MRFIKPSNIYNLIIYEKNGETLEIPEFIKNVIIESGENQIYAYDYNQIFQIENSTNEIDNDPLKAMMRGIIDISFKRCGIWVEGWNIITAKRNGRIAAKKVIEKWLLTTYEVNQIKEML